jgi:large subunit ribosomal protein L3
MGRRRLNAPRRGSLAYLPRGRAADWVARVRNWPQVNLDKPKLLGFPGYKVGMSYVYVLGEIRGNPTFGQEVYSPVTIVETPPMVVVGYRGYVQTVSGLQAATEVWVKKLPRGLDEVLSAPKKETPGAQTSAASKTFTEVRAIVSTQPRETGAGRKRPELIEVKVDGGSLKEELEYVNGLLGKEVQAPQVFAEGQFIDVAGVTKGKGIQGPVRRFGVKTKQHKSRKTVRELGTLGPWTPHYVMYTIPRAGQTGFHQRTEYNKRILKVGIEGKTVNPDGGFRHYGIIKRGYLVVAGSLPGPSKRTLMLRYAMRPPTMEEATVPKVMFSGIESARAA